MEKMTLLNDSLVYQKTNATRSDRNGAKAKKLGLKQGFKSLFVKNLKFQGLELKKTGTKIKLNLIFRGQKAKQGVLDVRFNFAKVQGLKQKR